MSVRSRSSLFSVALKKRKGTQKKEIRKSSNPPPSLSFLENHQRIVTPDRSVNILAAIFIACSSWNSSLAAYGMWICAILVLFLHGRHSNDCLERFLMPMLAHGKTTKPLKRRGELTQWASSTRRSRKCGHGRHPKPQIASLSRRPPRRAQSYNHVPSLQIEDRHHAHDPPQAVSS